VGLLLAIELKALSKPRPFLEGALQALFHKALSHPAHGSSAKVQNCGNLGIAQTFSGFEQNPSPC
jgi:hypothetical protein